MTDSRTTGGRYALRAPRRTLAVALVAGLVLPVGGQASMAAAAGVNPVSGRAVPGSVRAVAARPPIQPLPAELEAIRAQEATQLYGSPEIRPLEQRKSSIATMGDSEISGEGVGNYEPGTHQNGNWCDRSRDQAVFRLTTPAEVRYNIACSGATPQNLMAGGPRQWNELNQGDNLAIKARNTRLKLIWVVVGANGAGTIQFGPVATDCTIRRVLFQGPCWPTYTDQWATRVEGSRQQVEAALASIRQTMTAAGYDAADYELILQSYPSPGSPDVEDNPDFPGWYGGGCLLYLADVAFARNKAVPMFETALRQAARNAGVRYLDASRLFHGHEVCTDNTAVRGLYIEIGVWDENAARQSFHPNYRGHGLFAECMDQFIAFGAAEATCVDPASTGHGELRGGLLEFWQLRNAAVNKCVDARGYDSRNKTLMQPNNCHGGRNQGFWYDSGRQSLHIELSHDRCLDVKGGTSVVNAEVYLYNCHGGANQRWVFNGNRIRPADNANLCLAFDNPLLGTPRLRLASCGSSTRQQWSFEPRTANPPVGYGHSDFIGSRVY